eukprot:sb/3461380/
MCSQKEFLSRLEKRIWSVFETDKEEQFQHHLAVKEFQRSSADQDESQPEDLRPSIILQKTTQYLFLDLLSSQDDNLEEMYSFLWDRTRAIRKDITQQRLSDPRAVIVLETIARFHIFSAYYLAGPDHNYDERHNNENLEKTMTSLRHIYEDRDRVAGSCPNEAEFRMYHILLNLDSGKIMREVSNYPIAVMRSDEVRYAVQCYNAYNTKNFVRFFKLFRCGPLLACCILYRYINIVRQRALGALINSHTTQSVTEYPLEKLQGMLGFDSLVETVGFVESMEVEVKDKIVRFKKHCYTVHQNTLTDQISSVNQKITTTPGKIFYTAEVLPDSVLGSAIPATPTPTFTPTFAPVAAPPRKDLPQIPHLTESLAYVTVSLLSEACQREITGMLMECLQEQKALELAKRHIIVELLDEACRRGLREELKELKEERKNKINSATRDLFLDVCPRLFLEDLVKEVVWEEASDSFIKESHSEIMETVLKDELKTLLDSNNRMLSEFDISVARSCDSVLSDLVNTTVQRELSVLVPRTVTEMTAEKKRRLKEMLEQSTVQKRYFFTMWRKRCEKINAKRHALDNIPPRIVSLSSAQVLDNLLGSGRPKQRDPSLLPISRIANIDLTSPTKSFHKKFDVQKRLKMRMDLLEEAKAIRGIPLKCFNNPPPFSAGYITLLLDTVDSKLSQFLLDSFGLPSLSEIGDYFAEKVFIGSTTLKIQVVIMTRATIHTAKMACKRCHVVVANTTRPLPECASPVVLVAPSQPPSCPDGVTFIQQPEFLTNMGCCKLYKTLNSTIARYLSTDIPFQPFKLVDIRDLLQSVVCVKLTDVLLSKQVVLSKCPAYSVNPNEILTFYNSILRYLSRAVRLPDLTSINWPSWFDQRSDVLVDWNTTEKMSSLSSELEGMCLPAFRGEPDSPEDCLEFCRSIKTFSSQLLLSRICGIVEQSGVQWCSILNQIIHHVIENAVILNPHTALLEWQLNELGTLNGEQMVERALVYNELIDIEEGRRAERERAVSMTREDIDDIWESIQRYEAKLDMPPVPPENRTFLVKESESATCVSKELTELTCSLAKTELAMQALSPIPLESNTRTLLCPNPAQIQPITVMITPL